MSPSYSPSFFCFFYCLLLSLFFIFNNEFIFQQNEKVLTDAIKQAQEKWTNSQETAKKIKVMAETKLSE